MEHKKNLKISEAIIRRTDNAMANRKRTNGQKEKQIVDKAPYRKLKILQHERHYNGGELRCYRSVNSSCSSSGAHHLC